MAGNPDIVKHAKPFGSPDGPDPAEAGRKGAEMKHGVRRALKRICYHKFDVSPEGRQNLDLQLERLFGATSEMTGAEMAAVAKFTQALKNPKAMDTFIDAVDGKQLQRVAETRVSLADLVNASLEVTHDKRPPSNSSE